MVEEVVMEFDEPSMVLIQAAMRRVGEKDLKQFIFKSVMRRAILIHEEER